MPLLDRILWLLWPTQNTDTRSLAQQIVDWIVLTLHMLGLPFDCFSGG